MIAGGLSSSRRFCPAASRSVQAAPTMFALSAAALAHSESTAASLSSSLAPGSSHPPGLIWVRVPCGKAVERPKGLRKALQSLTQLPVPADVQHANGDPLAVQD